jgi:hypothetical protein
MKRGEKEEEGKEDLYVETVPVLYRPHTDQLQERLVAEEIHNGSGQDYATQDNRHLCTSPEAAERCY